MELVCAYEFPHTIDNNNWLMKKRITMPITIPQVFLVWIVWTPELNVHLNWCWRQQMYYYVYLYASQCNHPTSQRNTYIQKFCLTTDKSQNGVKTAVWSAVLFLFSFCYGNTDFGLHNIPVHRFVCRTWWTWWTERKNRSRAPQKKEVNAHTYTYAQTRTHTHQVKGSSNAASLCCLGIQTLLFKQTVTV